VGVLEMSLCRGARWGGGWFWLRFRGMVSRLMLE